MGSNDALLNEIKDTINGIRALMDRAYQQYSSLVDAVINDEITDINQIERIMDGLVDLGDDVRFIEMMPIGYGKDFEVIYNEDLRAALMARYPGTVEDVRVHGNGPASYLRLPGFQGSIGFISAMHGKFCAQCNRIRLTSTGKLKPCLCYGDTIDIKSIFERADATERQALLQQAIQEAIRQKPEAHCFEERAQVTELREMVEIGG